MDVPRGCRVAIYVYYRRLCGFLGVSFGYSKQFWRNLDESAAKQ